MLGMEQPSFQWQEEERLLDELADILLEQWLSEINQVRYTEHDEQKTSQSD